MPRPELVADHVSVRVIAAGTNPVDSECRSGKAAAWFDGAPYIWGWDVSGIVESVGAEVTAFAPGDEVYGMPRFPALAAAYAEYMSAPASELAPKPSRVDHIEAAALPLCGLTALQVLDLAGVVRGQRVLVNGAAGGVGHLAVQLAKARGAEVVGVARSVNHDFLRGIGADGLIDYTTTKVTGAVSDVDVLVDCVGDDGLLAVMRSGGVMAPVPGAAGGPGRLEELAKEFDVRVIRHVVRPDKPGLVRLANLVDAGRLAVDIDRTLPLADAARAHELLTDRHGRGKIVLNVAAA